MARVIPVIKQLNNGPVIPINHVCCFINDDDDDDELFLWYG